MKNKKILCKECGWEGNQYEIMIGIEDYYCPQCESTIELVVEKKIKGKKGKPEYKFIKQKS